MTDKPTQIDLEPTLEELRRISRRIDQQNTKRRASGLPDVDRHDAIRKATDRLRDDKFESILEPYLNLAYEQILGEPGVPGRLKQYISVYRRAEAALYDETCLRRPKAKRLSLIRFLQLYADGDLPSV